MEMPIGPDQYCYKGKLVQLNTSNSKSERNRGKRGKKHYITIVIFKTEARFRVVKIFPKIHTDSKETVGCVNSEVPIKFKIILFSFIDPKYQMERLYFKPLTVRCTIHLLNTTLSTEDTAVKRDREILTLMEFTL